MNIKSICFLYFVYFCIFIGTRSQNVHSCVCRDRKELEREYNESQTHKKESWDEYFQQVKDDLVKKENFQIIK